MRVFLIKAMAYAGHWLLRRISHAVMVAGPSDHTACVIYVFDGRNPDAIATAMHHLAEGYREGKDGSLGPVEVGGPVLVKGAALGDEQGGAEGLADEEKTQ